MNNLDQPAKEPAPRRNEISTSDAREEQRPVPTTATKPETTPAGQRSKVDQPKHPLRALTTFELRNYRRQLENAITFFDKQDPAPPVRDDLQAALDNVLAEQDDRQKIATA